MTGEAPSATARFYSNGRNSYSSLVPCTRRPSKMPSCSSSLISSLRLLVLQRLCFWWSLRVLKRSYKLSKPSGTSCSFRRRLRQLTKLLVRINLHRGYPTMTQLVFSSSAERDSTYSSSTQSMSRLSPEYLTIDLIIVIF
jgi:hypothetical protein